MRGLVLELTHGYGVTEIFGFRYGYEGAGAAASGHGPVPLTPTVGRGHPSRRAAPRSAPRAAIKIAAEMADRLDDLGHRRRCS